MKKNRRVVSLSLKTLTLLCFFLLPLLSFGIVRHVPSGYSSIQAAIDASADGAEIIVSPGVYYENINFNGKNVILRSTDPTSQTVVQSTIIDGRSSDSVVIFSGTENETCVLKGITICNGSSNFGGGIYGNGTLASIENNKIMDNRATSTFYGYGGGGIYGLDGTIQNNTISNNRAQSHGGGLARCDGAIENNTISGNLAWRGGGGLYGCNGRIYNNAISGNFAQSYGGGFFKSDGAIENNTISGNLAWRGGGLEECNGIIQNNIISSNSAYNAGGLYRCDGIIQNNTIYSNAATGPFSSGGGLLSCNATIRNCIIWQNSAAKNPQIDDCLTPSYSCIQNWTGGGTGNISKYPLMSDPENGDFHLDYESPCIDAGCHIDALTEDFEADPRPIYGTSEPRGDGSGYDIGADEFIAAPSNHPPHKPINLSPFNGETGVSLPSILESAAFSDPDSGDMHTASQWQIDNNIDFSSPEYDSGPDFLNKTSTIALSYNLIYSHQHYYWRIRHRDNHGYWGEWSDSTSFLTLRPSVITVPGDFPTIQEAIDAASGGDTIIVSQGTYYENINFLGKNITLRSTNPSSQSLASITIIDGSNADSVVTFSGTESAACVLSGFTITNGSATAGGGVNGNSTMGTIQNNIISGNLAHDFAGGLYKCYGMIQNNIISGNTSDHGGGLSGCDGTIQNNVIFDNWAYASGGGLYKCDSIIQNNMISGNSAYLGGGMFECQGTIQNNTISGNSAQVYGGGLYECDGTVQNNIILSNTADYRGGGLYGCDGIMQNNMISGNWARNNGGGFEYCHGSIQNNTIVGNSAQDYGGGLNWCLGIIRNCIIWQNTAPSDAQLSSSATPSYSCIQDWTGGGEGNISSDPQFVDPENWDFHLLPSSPCIDAGGYVEYLTEDFEGDPRPYDGTSEPRGDGSDYDIGADEFPGVFSLREYNFDLTEEGWGLVEISHFTPPHFEYTPGYLILTAQDNTNTYGFWTSELDAVPVIADCLYRASWTVATDVTDPLAVPNMLLRVNSQNFQQADMLVVSSAGDGSYAPTPEGRTYEMYFVPPESALGKPEDQDDLILSFDIMNSDVGDVADGSLMLDSVVVEAIPLDTLSTPTMLKTWSFETDSEGWEFGSVPIFTAPLSGIGAGALWLIAQDNTNTFGFWSGPSEEVEMEEGKLYRLRFTVMTDVMVQDNVPHFRLRASSEDFQSSVVKLISSFTGAGMSPTPAGRSYDLYFYPPQSLAETPQNGFLAAFDILNFDPGDSASGALMLDEAVVESFDLVP